jgi:membrane-associated phospholipid phosphatase
MVGDRSGGAVSRRRLGVMAAGLGCLAAAVLIGLVARSRGTWLDHGLPRAAGRLMPPDNRLVQVLSSELGWPSGAYLTALLPVAVAMALLAGEVRRRGPGPVLRRWRWVLLTLVAIPFHYVLRLAFGRPGPGEVAGDGLYVGAYPSGAALAVGLGWMLCLVVAGELRPRWWPWLVAVAAVMVTVHAVARAVTDKHWVTDILGSYLLVAGAFLLAASTSAGREPARRATAG